MCNLVTYIYNINGSLINDTIYYIKCTKQQPPTYTFLELLYCSCYYVIHDLGLRFYFYLLF